MKPGLQTLTFDGAILQRGFWLYVWEITPVGAAPLYYVGRTGESSSTHAQSRCKPRGPVGAARRIHARTQ